MKIGLIIVLGSLVLFSTAWADFDGDISALENYSLHDSAGVMVENFTINIAHGHIRLKSGTVYMTGYWRGRPTAAFFIGRGEVRYNPADRMERQQIDRFYKTDSVSKEIDYAYFAFPANSDIFESLPAIPSNAHLDFRQRRIFKHCRELPDREFYYHLPFQIYKSSVEGHDDYLYIDMVAGEYDHTIYSFIPYDNEPISLYKFSPGHKKPQLVSSVRIGPDLNGDEFTVRKYDIDANICTYCKSDIACTMQILAHTDSLKCLSFTLPKEYKIDSIGGHAVEYIKTKDRAELHFVLDDYYSTNDTVSIQVYYRTNMFYHIFDVGVIQMNLTQWLPYHGFRQLSDYEIYYVIDDGFSFISVGKQESRTVEKGMQYLHYHTERPVAYVSFNYGVFDTLTVDSSVVPVNLYYLKNRHNSVVFGRQGVNKVAGDIGEAFKYFHHNIAPYQFERLEVDAMAVGFGQGSPGMVHLSEITFSRSEEGVDDKFRAHEVAHQWWGHLVSPRSYRDLWLSEGLAEFSGAMYVLKAKKDDGTFFRILKNWRKHVVSSGRLNGQKSVGYKAGPLVLGSRLINEKSAGDYTAIVYYKGAFVVNMLRYELKVKYGEDRIMEVLGAFAKEYYNKIVSTEDFRGVVARYLGDRTEHFFNQWVYDWRLPRIRKDSHRNDDKSLSLKFEVDRVDEKFSTPYPVRILFDDNSFEMHHFNLNFGENKFNYQPPEGKKVKAIDYNPFMDILEL